MGEGFTRDQGVLKGGHIGEMKGVRGWIACRNGMNRLITIR